MYWSSRWKLWVEISNQLERNYIKLCPSQGKNQYELMTLARNTFCSALLFTSSTKNQGSCPLSYSHMQDSLQSCWFHVLGQELISVSLELLLLPQHQYVHKNIKGNTERTKGPLKGDSTSQSVMIWVLNNNHKTTHNFRCWLKQAKSMKVRSDV